MSVGISGSASKQKFRGPPSLSGVQPREQEVELEEEEKRRTDIADEVSRLDENGAVIKFTSAMLLSPTLPPLCVPLFPLFPF